MTARPPRPFSGYSDRIGAAERTDIMRRDHAYRRALVGADVVAAVATIALALTAFGAHRLNLAVFAAAPLAVLISKLVGLYDRDDLVLRKSTLDEAPALFELATLYTLVFWLFEDVLVPGGELGKGQVLALWCTLFVAAFAARFIARKHVRRRVTRERCLVVGDLAGGRTIAAKLEGATSGNAELVAQVPLDFAADRDGAMATLHEAIRTHRAHRVLIVPGSADSEVALDAVRMAKSLGVKVSLLPRLFEVVGSSVVFDEICGITVLGVRRFGLTRSSAAIKRVMDILGAGLGLVVIAPVLAFVAAAVRLDTPGPILFRQTRVGRDGEPFEMVKFRSMVDGADAMKAVLAARNESDGLFKMSEDPRVTRVGRFLRSTSLDELPQLINVLRGDMSLVGPRPLVVDEDAMVHGWHRRRLHLTPGMTGPWQVLGSRQVPLQEMVKIDYIYISNWSFWLDMKILVRTALHVLHRAGV